MTEQNLSGWSCIEKSFLFFLLFFFFAWIFFLWFGGSSGFLTGYGFSSRLKSRESPSSSSFWGLCERAKIWKEGEREREGLSGAFSLAIRSSLWLGAQLPSVASNHGRCKKKKIKLNKNKRVWLAYKKFYNNLLLFNKIW